MQTSPAHSGARHHQAAGVGQELGQVDLGTATEMTDDFGSAQTAGLAADGKRHNADQGIGEAAGVKIALPGGIDRLSRAGARFRRTGKDPRRLGRASGARTPLNPRQLNKNFALPGVQQDAVERLDAALRPHLQG